MMIASPGVDVEFDVGSITLVRDRLRVRLLPNEQSVPMEVPAQMGQQVRALVIARKDDGGPALEWVDDRAIEILMQIFFDDLVEMRSEEHTSELQSLMRSSNAVLCLTTK